MLKSYYPKDRHADVKFQILRNGNNESTDAWVNMLKMFNDVDFYAIPVEERPQVNTIASLGDGLHYRLHIDAAHDVPTYAELADATLEFVVESKVGEEKTVQLLRNLPKKLLDAGILTQSEFVVFDRDVKQHFSFGRLVMSDQDQQPTLPQDLWTEALAETKANELKLAKHRNGAPPVVSMDEQLAIEELNNKRHPPLD